MQDTLSIVLIQPVDLLKAVVLMQSLFSLDLSAIMVVLRNYLENFKEQLIGNVSSEHN